MSVPHELARANLENAVVKTSPLRKEIIKLMQKNRVSFVNGKPDFKNSVFKQDAGVKEMFSDALRLTRQPRAKASDVEHITTLIDSKFNDLLSQGREIKGLDVAVKKVKSIVNKGVYGAGKAGKEFQKTDTNLAKILKPLGQLESAGTVQIGNKGKKFDAYQIINRSLTKASGKSDEAISSIKKIRKEFGLKGPKNLELKAELANIAERMSGTFKPGSLEGVGAQVGSAVADVTPGGRFLGQAFKFAKSLKKSQKGIDLLGKVAKGPAKPTPQPISNFLKKNLTGAGSQVIIPSVLSGLFVNRKK
jgi:hypothetical protein